MQKKLHLLIAMMVFVVSSAMAQVTTSSLSGAVTLESTGEELIGATVQAVHVPSGTKYAAVTNVKGRYTIIGMRAGGPYKITVSYIGAQTKEFDDITLNLGETFDLNVWLSDDAQQLGEVAVIGKAGLAASRNGAAMSFSKEDIDNVPSVNHSIADATRLNPMVNISQSGAMSFAGTSNKYNSFMVDGAMNNDVFGLTSNGQNGGQSNSQPISMETVEQIQVQVAPFDVRQSGFTGGSINAITKSGTNEFHGSIYGDWLNQELIGKKYTLRNGNVSDPYQDETNFHAGVTLGGPIVKDKLFFFASYERSKEQYPNNYGLGAAASKIDATEAQKLLDFMVKNYNYTGTFNNPNNSTISDKAGLKLDWNINDTNKFTLGYRIVSSKYLSGNSTAAYLDATDYQYDFASITNNVTAELNSQLSSKVSNQLMASYVGVRDNRSPYGNIFPMIQISNVGSGTVCFGTERSSTANALNQDTWTLTDNLDWYLGNHTLTFGVHGEYYTFGNLFIQDNYGTYYFNSPDDFYAFAGGDSSAIKQYRYIQADTSVTGTTRWTPTFSAGQIGGYVQDKWNVTNKFTLTYGLRVDAPIFFDAPTENTTFNDLAAKQGWDLKTNQKLKSTPMWSPRLGFRWNIDGNSKFVLRGGAGLFTGRIPFVWLSNSFSNTGIQLLKYNASGKSVTGAGLSFITDPNGQMANASKLTSGSSEVDVFAKDFKFTQNARFNLALDANILGIDWTLEGVYSKTLNDIVYKDLTRELSGKTLGETYSSLSFDNRPMLQKGSFTSGTSFSNIYELSNTNKGYTYNLSVSAMKKFNFGLDIFASYTYTQSKSVNYGGSSVAQSNYQYNYIHGNPNDPELGYSAYNTPHKINVSVNFHKDYAKHWNTTVGLIYTGTSGSPYSIYVSGDLNGDGQTGNDLMFIPTKEQISQMVFEAKGNYTAEQQAENFNAWIENDSYLSKHRGEYYERFADNEEFEHHVDFHFAQTYKFKIGKQMRSITLTCNIQNIANLLNKDWGHYTSNGASNYYSPLSYSGSGKFTFLHDADYDMRSYLDYYSRWRGQIGLKYTF